MAFLKKWKENWELKSLTFDELFNVIVEIVTKQLDEVEKSEVELGANLVIDYEADSVDVVVSDCGIDVEVFCIVVTTLTISSFSTVEQEVNKIKTKNILYFTFSY